MSESKPNNNFLPVGAHVVYDKQTIGTILEVAKNAKYPEDSDFAIYKVEYDTFWGKRTKWIQGSYYLHMINSEVKP